jgi:SAM-dependent methyltransferase
MNAENLEYADGSLDAITCSGVLHHIDTERALRSWARCLKKDGAVIMLEPLACHPAVALFRLLTPSMRTPDEHPLRARDFRLMHKYFGRVERAEYGLFTPICAGNAVVPGLRWLARAVIPTLETLDAAIIRILPFLRGLCWLTVIRLTQPRPRTGVKRISPRFVSGHLKERCSRSATNALGATHFL